MFDPAQAETLSDALRALANPTRLRLVAFLAEKGERTVGDLARSLALTQAATSQALAALRNGGLVKVRRDGGFRYYDLAVPDVVVLIQCLAGCCRNHGRSPAAEE